LGLNSASFGWKGWPVHL